MLAELLDQFDEADAAYETWMDYVSGLKGRIRAALSRHDLARALTLLEEAARTTDGDGFADLAGEAQELAAEVGETRLAERFGWIEEEMRAI